jgi:hypothetical protein
MSNTSKRVLRIMFVSVAITCGPSLNDLTVTGPRMVNPAQAYIGNPLTPMSYAGVARRTARRQERREYYYGGGGGYPYGGYPRPGGGYPYGGYPPPGGGYPYGNPYP